MSLYKSIWKGCLRGWVSGACCELMYRWSIVSSGSAGKSAGGRRYNSVDLYFRGAAVGFPYGRTS